MKQQILHYAGILLRFIVCGALAWMWGRTAATIVIRFQPEFLNRAVDISRPLSAVILACWSAHFAILALGGSFWRAVLWADRVAILGETYFCWQLRMLLNHEQWIGIAISLVCLALFHYVAHRHALGWIVDSHGERQKVTHWVRGEPIYTPTSRKQRLKEEAEERNIRRWKILGSGVVGLPLAWWALHLHPPSSWLLAVALGAISGPFLVLLLIELGGELLYLAGYQEMKGHKVLDGDSSKPGLANVTTQMAHGAATVASPEDALNLLREGK